jgi:Uma2 family endonuclease
MNMVLENTQAVVLHNISWNSYKQITDVLQDETPAHFTYDRGKLEIMVLSLKHEHLKKLLAMLFERLAENLEIEIFAAGSTTFQREDLGRGFEPDECYYVQNAELMRGKETVDLDFDPPPDLTIEIDVKHSSLNRMSIFAAIRVPEVWRFSGGELEMFSLRETEYEISENSGVLPGVKGVEITRLLEFGIGSTRKEFLKQIDDYTKRISA